MKTIVCHPANLTLLREKFHEQEFDETFTFMGGIEFKTNPHMERERPSGQYRLPDGSILDKERVTVKTRFIDYGPEDIDWLVYAGIIEELREPLFYEMDMDKFRFDIRMNYGVITPPRYTNYPPVF